jgi:hypothetical protein
LVFARPISDGRRRAVHSPKESFPWFKALREKTLQKNAMVSLIRQRIGEHSWSIVRLFLSVREKPAVPHQPYDVTQLEEKEVELRQSARRQKPPTALKANFRQHEPRGRTP